MQDNLTIFSPGKCTERMIHHGDVAKCLSSYNSIGHFRRLVENYYLIIYERFEEHTNGTGYLCLFIDLKHHGYINNYLSFL
jgi:hypothetical protein